MADGGPPTCGNCGAALVEVVEHEREPGRRYWNHYRWDGSQYRHAEAYYQPRKGPYKELRCAKCKSRIGRSASIRARKLGVD